MSTITPAQARKEIARRKLAKGSEGRDKRPAKHILDASGPLLADIASSKPAPKLATKAQPAVKVPKVPSLETQLRKLAWTMRLEAKAAGQRMTYPEACALVGVKPAHA
jgi:hypothetical protein